MLNGLLKRSKKNLRNLNHYIMTEEKVLETMSDENIPELTSEERMNDAIVFVISIIGFVIFLFILPTLWGLAQFPLAIILAGFILLWSILSALTFVHILLMMIVCLLYVIATKRPNY